MAIARKVYRWLNRRICMLNMAFRLRLLERIGLYQYRHVIPARPSVTPFSQAEALKKLYLDTFPVPNISRFYHGILRDWWGIYGLGKDCLLMSESIETRKAFSLAFPQTKFTATDYYVDMQSCAQTDVIWDMCLPSVPESLGRGFDSVVCQATMEHVWNPEAAMKNLFSVLRPSGKLYLHTHTPCFPYHDCPRDYLRFWPDWFADVGRHFSDVRLLELLCVSGHAFAVYEKQRVER